MSPVFKGCHMKEKLGLLRAEPASATGGGRLGLKKLNGRELSSDPSGVCHRGHSNPGFGGWRGLGVLETRTIFWS